MNKPISTPKRDPNMEALRIVAMSMILIYHFLIHSMTAEDIPGGLFYFFNDLVYGGVDLFFLISGYFLIKSSLRSIVKFYVGMMFFAAVNVVLLACAGVTMPATGIIRTIMLPAEPHWFLRVYLILLITAPLINRQLTELPLNRLRNIIILTIIGFMIIRDGTSHSYLNALLFYAIGHYLRRLTTATTFSRSRCLTVFLAATLLSAVIHYTTRTTYLLRYDNLLLIIATPALLLFFSKLTIKPRVINSIAAASLGCYMLQDGRFGKDFFYR